MTVENKYEQVPQDVEYVHESVQQSDHVTGVPMDHQVPMPMGHMPESHIVTTVRVPDFSYGLCSCFDDMSVCCDVMWCSPCLLGRTYDAIIQNKPNSMNVGVCAGVSAAGMAGYAAGVFVNFGLGLAPLGSILYSIGCLPYTYVTCQQRKELRRHLSMQENDCEDCLLSWFCISCVQCQISRESNRLGMAPGGCCCQPQQAVVVQTVVPNSHQVVQPAYPHGNVVSR